MELDTLFNLATNNPSKIMDTVLLFLILLQLRSLKNAIMKLETDHDKRIVNLETKQQNYESRLAVLERGN